MNGMHIQGIPWPAAENWTELGQLGDYVGGFWGTVISAFAFVALLLTWRSSSRTDKRNSTIAVLSEMLKTHDQIVSQSAKSYLSKEGPPARLLSEFYEIYGITHSVNPDMKSWSIDDRVDIAYTIAYYGPTSQARDALDRFDKNSVKLVHDAVSTQRNLPNRSDQFKGYQLSISHYMRNLFAMYSTIDRSGLPKNQKKQLGKIVRAKLSNYEQAVLALNIISHLGRTWEVDGLVTRYKPFTNIPKLFFSFDSNFSLKERFPQIRFEWESKNGKRPWYRRVRIFSFFVTVSR